jgi:cell division transport system ATP-binding protein
MILAEGVGLRYGGGGESGVETRGLGAPDADHDGGDAPEVLRGLSFSVPGGGWRWLLGPSGAGKSSLLRLLHVAARPTRGRLNLMGVDVGTARRSDLPPLRRRIGMVYQDFRLLAHLSVFDNVALPLRLSGRPEGQLRADVTEMLRWVGLGKVAGARPPLLSGGEQQRAAIARAVITRPLLLLADEPTGNLDDVQAERLMVLLQEMNRLGTTVICATHNMQLVDRYPGPALELASGRLVRDG